MAELTIPAKLKRGRGASADSAELGLESLHDVAAMFGGATPRFLEGKSVLEIGCGNQIPEAIFKYNVELSRYVGVDVDKSLIDLLNGQAAGSHAEFVHVDFYNQKHNRDGEIALHPHCDLGLGEALFDYILAIDVAFCLGPEDLDAYLNILLRHAHKDTRLVFSCLFDSDIAKFRSKDAANPISSSVFSPNYVRWKQLSSISERCSSRSGTGR